MITGRNGKQKLDGKDEAMAFSNCRESTASGMFSWSGLHLELDWWGGCTLYMIARNTAETVGMYAVLFLASSHVSPISWQSLLNILLALSLVSWCPVPFLYPPLSCKLPFKVTRAILSRKQVKGWGWIWHERKVLGKGNQRTFANNVMSFS